MLACLLVHDTCLWFQIRERKQSGNLTIKPRDGPGGGGGGTIGTFVGETQAEAGPQHCAACLVC